MFGPVGIIFIFEILFESPDTLIFRPELLEHASKFYGVKFRNKVAFFICYDHVTNLVLRCRMWTVLQKRKPSTLWMTMPPRVEETNTHVPFFFSCNVINHVWSKAVQRKNIVSTKRCHWKSCHPPRKNGFARGATTTTVLLIFWTLCLFQPEFV